MNSWSSFNWVRFSLLPWLCFSIFIIFVVSADMVRAQAPVLAPGDEIEIEVFARPEYATQAVIDGEGEIPINGLGRFVVAGMRPVEVDKAVQLELEKLRVITPLVTTRVIAYREVGILGDVAQPGSFPYRENMLVLHGLAQAGGFRRPENEEMNADLALVDAQSQLSSLLGELAFANIRRNRLSAQINGQDFTSTSMDESARLYERTETEIADTMAAERNRDQAILTQQLDAINEQITLRNDIRNTYREQQQLAEENVARMQQLFDKGLTGKDRLTSAQDSLSRITVDLLENEAAYAAALQDRASVELSLAALSSPRSQILVQELRDATAEIAQLERDISATENSLRVLQLQSTNAALLTNEEGKVEESRFSVARMIDGVVRNISLAETDLLLPGDVLTVTRYFSEEN
ncbi:MAG: polysaccharide biosynthesis/export family protein [Mangrovicoccus sp.]